MQMRNIAEHLKLQYLLEVFESRQFLKLRRMLSPKLRTAEPGHGVSVRKTKIQFGTPKTCFQPQIKLINYNFGAWITCFRVKGPGRILRLRLRKSGPEWNKFFFETHLMGGRASPVQVLPPPTAFPGKIYELRLIKFIQKFWLIFLLCLIISSDLK